MFYPIYLNLKDKRVIVIGGGEVAERKVHSLLGTGADITVISPEVTSTIESLAQSGRIHLLRRRYVDGDCDDATLVFSATDDPAVSAEVFNRSALVNTADQPELCDFIMPAVMRRGDITVAISTGGSSPGLAARLRDEVTEIIGPEYGELAALLRRVRPEILNRVPDQERRKALHYRILDSDIIERLKRGDSKGAERRLRELMES